MHVRRCFRGQSPSEICGGHVEKRSPLRQADETTTDKATLPKSDYGRCKHLCDVIISSGDGPDYDNRFWKFGTVETAFIAFRSVKLLEIKCLKPRQKFLLELSLLKKEFITCKFSNVAANRPPDPDNERVLRAAGGFIEFVSSGISPHFPATPRKAQTTVARIARLAGARTQLERRFVHVGGGGGGGGDRDRSLVWREIDAAFERRVMTGAVINCEHIEPRQFLEDACSIMLERVRGAVERHGSVKVNTAFNGEFVAGDIRTVMGINTKNCELYPASNIREWYVC
ncbi:hypothetical protein ALC62_13103 [Cyphomyrmex costatus]|uniref:Uncharacterized protein n=1 Tax=Cyphomyrmex costatus TaxID=456900 RepID=A0A151IAA3_9HYME|nr:hypothetical protein ALC62_13103 [Cyphomyrmex costatus]